MLISSCGEHGYSNSRGLAYRHCFDRRVYAQSSRGVVQPKELREWDLGRADCGGNRYIGGVVYPKFKAMKGVVVHVGGETGHIERRARVSAWREELCREHICFCGIRRRW